MALSLNGRALHYVFKVGDRKATMNFYKDILGMQVLRHEEFSEGCVAACNGLYDNRWSKTMVGYGPESTHFAIELTYNYGVKSYELGNDFLGITIRSPDILKRAKAKNLPIETIDTNKYSIEAPGGYKYHIINEQAPKDKDPIEKVCLSCSDLTKTIKYWKGMLGLQIFNAKDKSVLFAFDENQCKVEFKEIPNTINHAKAYGRIAFSVPLASLSKIQEKMEHEKQTILTPIVTLETPSKPTVTVIILADPDKYEICFVDDESFRQLSAVDSSADLLLDKYIKLDKS